MVQLARVSRHPSTQPTPIEGGVAAPPHSLPLKGDSINSSSQSPERGGFCGWIAKEFRGLLELIRSLVQRLLGKQPEVAPRNDKKDDLSIDKPHNPPQNDDGEREEVEVPDDKEAPQGDQENQLQEGDLKLDRLKISQKVDLNQPQGAAAAAAKEELLPEDLQPHEEPKNPADMPAAAQALSDVFRAMPDEPKITQNVDQNQRIDLNQPQRAAAAAEGPLRKDLQLPKEPKRPADMPAAAQVGEADVQAAAQALPDALRQSVMQSYRQAAPVVAQPSIAPPVVQPWIQQILQNWDMVSKECLVTQLTPPDKQEARTKLSQILPIVPLFLDFTRAHGPQSLLIAGDKKKGSYKIILNPSGKILLVLLARVAGGTFKKKRDAYWLNPPLSRGQTLGMGAVEQAKQAYAYLTAAGAESAKPQMELEAGLCDYISGSRDQTGLMTTLDVRFEVRKPPSLQIPGVLMEARPPEKAVRMKLMQVNCKGALGGTEWQKVIEWLRTLNPQQRAVVIVGWMLELAQGSCTFHETTDHIHSDIKPENVLFNIDSARVVHLCLTDYGLAQRRASPFAFSGTPLFWPPSAMLFNPTGVEQLRSMGGVDADFLKWLLDTQAAFKISPHGRPDRIDMHGLGRVFYFLLTGKQLPNYSMNTANAMMKTGQPMVLAVMGTCMPQFEEWHAQCKQHSHELVQLIAWMTSDNFFRRQDDPEALRWTPPTDGQLINCLAGYLARAQGGQFFLPDCRTVPA